MPSILLIEDNADQRHLYRDVLAEAGFDVREAATGPEALASAKSCPPDLVVLDIQMPGMDGIEVLSKLLAEDKSIPILFHSAYPAFKSNFMTWAADAFVEKTGNPQDLVDAVRTLAGAHGLFQPLKEAAKKAG